MGPGESLSVAVIGLRWPPETFLARLLEGLLKAGVRVTVACSRRPGREWRAREGFDWLFTPAWEGAAAGRLVRWGWLMVGALGRSPADVRRLGFSVAQSRTLAGRLSAWMRLLPFAGRRWDVLYFPWNSAAIAYLPLFDLGCPVVLSCRGSQVQVAPHNPERQAIRDGLRETFQRAAAVHCVSEAVRDEACGYGLDPGKAWIIRPAVDPDFFQPASSRRGGAGELRVVTIGNLSWVKGHEYALLAIWRLVDQGVPVRFDIIGEGPERGRILYTVHDLELGDRVHLLGRLAPEAVRARLQQADAFLLSSLSEGISNAVLEAMACGLPVVTTDCGGMREAVTDGVEGFVVPVRDPAAMALALERLWREPELRRRMGTVGRQRVEREFALDRQVEKFKQLFEAVTTGRET